jgi:hypothetical protein
MGFLDFVIDLFEGDSPYDEGYEDGVKALFEDIQVDLYNEGFEDGYSGE